MLRIGPSGNSNSFYEQGYKHTFEAAKWVSDMGLNAFEYSFGRGISLSFPTAAKIGEEMAKYDVQISAHAPYYTNFSSVEPDKVQRTFGYVASSIAAVKMMGGERVVVHPGYVGALKREDAVSLAAKNLEGLNEFLEEQNLGEYLICIETLGRHQQIGTPEEVLQMIKPFKNMTACIDFGHVNSYTGGGLKTKDDYRKILDATFKELGEDRAKKIHIHFSKIMYNGSGEVKHLSFDDTVYGPEYKPLAQLIDEYKMSPTVICESNGTMAEDALYMKKCHANP